MKVGNIRKMLIVLPNANPGGLRFFVRKLSVSSINKSTRFVFALAKSLRLRRRPLSKQEWSALLSGRDVSLYFFLVRECA